MSKMHFRVWWLLCIMIAAPAFRILPAGAAEPAPVEVSGDDAEMGLREGIREVTIRRTASGAILDVRYRIADGRKAEAFMDPRNVLRLIHQETGRELAVVRGKLGRMRQVPVDPEADRVYFTLFSNPGGLVKSGDRVTLLMGGVKIENLQVE